MVATPASEPKEADKRVRRTAMTLARRSDGAAGGSVTPSPTADELGAASRIERRSGTSDKPDPGESVACVIPTFDHADLLSDAITSALAQTRPPDEIVVVDDGSRDDPASVVAGFPGVRLVRQENRGASAARNAGLRVVSSSYIVFLDADDLLLPLAIETGLAMARKHRACAFVYGGYRYVSRERVPLGPDKFVGIDGDPHLALMRTNCIGMLGTVLFRRDCLIAVGGFDEALRSCEDYDLFLRLAREYAIVGHRDIIAEYRWHGQNTSARYAVMLSAALTVLDSHQQRIAADEAARSALDDGRRHWRNHYAWLSYVAALERRRCSPRAIGVMLAGLLRACVWAPRLVIDHHWRRIVRQTRSTLPAPIIALIQRQRGRPGSIPFGAVRWGHLKRLSPIDAQFGYGRGTPIDRYYVERFLARHSADIRGRVLEIGDDAYTRRYGGSLVTHSDIFHVDDRNATFTGDLADRNSLPEALFDCIILTQTLQLLFDLRAAIATLHRALKRGGVLLATTPGISQIDHSGEWSDTWHWSLTANSLRRLLEERFPPGGVKVEAHGNVFAATAFLHGLAQEEIALVDLDTDDPSYPVNVTGRAVKGCGP
jgi:glycosyltransferase involved in cell wall biosynthesis